MKTPKTTALRLLGAGMIIAGGVALPLAAGAQDSCGDASPSDTNCGTTTVVTTTTIGEVQATTTATPTTVAEVLPTTLEKPPAAVLDQTVSQPSANELAFTGGDAIGLGAIGAGAILAGAAAITIRKRRED